jgi:GABA permease
VHKYLVVANQTLSGEHLVNEVRARLSSGRCQFHVLVPATHPTEHALWTEGEAEAIARGNLAQALEIFRKLGAQATGEIGDEQPLTAIRDVLRDQEFDEIILSTLPAGISRWLGQDLVSRVERSFAIPVTHVVGDEPAAPNA